jgi:lysozyme
MVTISTLKKELIKNDNSQLTVSSGKIFGIDVSHHQGDINWNKVKKWKDKSIQFVYIKATEGATYVDKTYEKNFKGAKEQKILTGSYHYFRTTSSVKDQFKNFIQTISKEDQDLIPMIDVEEKKNWNNKEFHKNFKEFLGLIENHFGQKPMIYTVNSFYNINLSGKYNDYHFLIARYGKNSPNMRDKSNWTIWQFSETGKVDGIPKLVDIDVINSKFSLSDIKMK